MEAKMGRIYFSKWSIFLQTSPHKTLAADHPENHLHGHGGPGFYLQPLPIRQHRISTGESPRNPTFHACPEGS
jgi:hypothetical protein